MGLTALAMVVLDGRASAGLPSSPLQRRPRPSAPRRFSCRRSNLRLFLGRPPLHGRVQIHSRRLRQLVAEGRRAVPGAQQQPPDGQHRRQLRAHRQRRHGDDLLRLATKCAVPSATWPDSAGTNVSNASGLNISRWLCRRTGRRLNGSEVPHVYPSCMISLRFF